MCVFVCLFECVKLPFLFRFYRKKIWIQWTSFLNCKSLIGSFFFQKISSSLLLLLWLCWWFWWYRNGIRSFLFDFCFLFNSRTNANAALWLMPNWPYKSEYRIWISAQEFYDAHFLRSIDFFSTSEKCPSFEMEFEVERVF